ncbi:MULTISPECIES: sensor histidine kinase [unclassified Rathayibacter]|uniref:sensor histidine kinase n=1 Tax=unclassified Rathayibacter TaxID=2609250 RepID=UPI0006FDD6D7|nr:MULTISPECIES: ATP-binding protein [unclassified Rathayibacter]KQQ05749.1 hypothetical protein ASF42_04065 [Rathayibacter sp. Leaf294]KQS13607.1 hypothetical protein ASG06_04075 [Rathayibacter sp. Leaf185]
MTTPADASEDSRILLGVVALLGGVLSVLAALQAVIALGMLSEAVRGVEGGPVIDVVVRVIVNGSSFGLAIALLAVVRPERFRKRGRVLWTAVISVGVAAVRCLLQVLTGVYSVTAVHVLLVELVVGAVVLAMITAFGFLLVRAARRVREKERAHARVVLQAVDAVQALQQEELRVRRDIAQRLHGALQGTLVVLVAELRAATALGDPARLAAVAVRLDELRENEVRAAGNALHPVDIEHGLVPAVRDLFARLPPEIAVDLDVDHGYPELEARSIPVDQRVLLVRVVEEALTNALKHGGARAVRLQLAVEVDDVVLGLEDDGRGIAPDARWSGLERLSRQFAVYGGSLELLPSAALGGARLAARLPLR